MPASRAATPLRYAPALKFPEQRRIFRMIPGLEKAEFLRLGQIHRNTYIDAPQALLPTMAARKDGRVFFAGQYTYQSNHTKSTQV